MPTEPSIELTETEVAELIKSNRQADLVYNWMKVRGYYLGALRTEGLNFEFQGKSDSQLMFSITQPEDRPRSLVIVANLDFLPSHLEAMSKLEPQQKDAFLWNIKRELIFAPAVFRMEPNLYNPQKVQFSKEVSFDELSEGRLFDAVDAISRSIVWTIWSFIRKFGIPQEVQQND